MSCPLLLLLPTGSEKKKILAPGLHLCLVLEIPDGPKRSVSRMPMLALVGRGKTSRAKVGRGSHPDQSAQRIRRRHWTPTATPSSTPFPPPLVLLSRLPHSHLLESLPCAAVRCVFSPGGIVWVPSAGPTPRDGGVCVAFTSFTLTKPTHTEPASPVQNYIPGAV